MNPHLASKRWIVAGLAAVIIASIGTMAHLSAQVQPAASGQPSVAAPAGQDSPEDVRALRHRLDQATQEILQARARLNQIMFERIKSIKRRQGLTPAEANAFDDAFAAELDRVNRAQQQLDLMRLQLTAREQKLAAKTAATPAITPPPAATASILERLESLERRVTALEMAQDQ